jgi:drug/metabolite transporter (DMT)-like permease
MAEKISPVFLYMLMLGMLITGTINTVSLKLQNLEKYFNKSTGENQVYNHAFFQTFNMFIGEFLCLGVYAVQYIMDKRKYGNVNQSPAILDAKARGLKTNINVCLLAIPASFDVLASSLMFLALTMIPASIYQMMRGLIVFVAAILSIIFLKRRFHRHHWTSLALVVGGVAIVGASPIIYPEKNKDDGDEKLVYIGIILVVIAQLFAGGLMISEEMLLGDYYLHPLKVVGWEGFWGCFIYLILLTIFQFIPCGSGSGSESGGRGDICPYGRLEDTPQALYEYGQNWKIAFYGIGSIFSIAFFNAFGVAVTKYSTAAQRSTIDTSRTLLIWIIFLVKPGDGRERFIWLELVGFFMLVAGTLIFNEIVIIPICGFDRNTKKKLAEKKQKDAEDGIENGLLESETDENDKMPASDQGNNIVLQTKARNNLINTKSSKNTSDLRASDLKVSQSYKQVDHDED